MSTALPNSQWGMKFDFRPQKQTEWNIFMWHTYKQT